MVRSVLSLVAFMLFAAAPPLAARAQTPAASHATPRSAAKPALAAPLNINTASATELQALPGIGAKTAARIVEYRQKNGPFKKIEEILENQCSCPDLLAISR